MNSVTTQKSRPILMLTFFMYSEFKRYSLQNQYDACKASRGTTIGNTLYAVWKWPVVAGVQVGVDERAGDAVEGGGVGWILEVL